MALDTLSCQHDGAGCMWTPSRRPSQHTYCSPCLIADVLMEPQHNGNESEALDRYPASLHSDFPVHDAFNISSLQLEPCAPSWETAPSPAPSTGGRAALGARAAGNTPLFSNTVSGPILRALVATVEAHGTSYAITLHDITNTMWTHSCVGIPAFKPV